jgi:hypothetical protein
MEKRENQYLALPGIEPFAIQPIAYGYDLPAPIQCII